MTVLIYSEFNFKSIMIKLILYYCTVIISDKHKVNLVIKSPGFSFSKSGLPNLEKRVTYEP